MRDVIKVTDAMESRLIPVSAASTLSASRKGVLHKLLEIRPVEVPKLADLHQMGQATHDWHPLSKTHARNSAKPLNSDKTNIMNIKRCACLQA